MAWVPTGTVLSSYFLVFLSCLSYALFHGFRARKTVALHIWLLFLTLSLVSLGLTWYHIGRFMVTSFAESKQTLEAFLRDSDLFVETYRMVCKTPAHWWWSNQLLLFTCSLITFMWHQGALFSSADKPTSASGSTNRAGTVVFVLLGFFGAISVAFPLYMLWIWSSSNEDKSQRKLSFQSTNKTKETEGKSLPVYVWVSLLLALGSILMTPHISVDSPTFTLSLFFLHFILLLPILLRGHSPVRLSSVFPLYVTITTVTFLAHAYVTYATVADLLPLSPSALATIFPRRLASALFENDCQISISVDYIMATVEVSALYAVSLGSRQGHFGEKVAAWVLFTLACMLTSLAVVFPLFIGRYLMTLHGRQTVNKSE